MTTWDGTELAPPALPLINSAIASSPGAPTLARLGMQDLARLTLGFYFVFWGALGFLAALTESLTAQQLRLFHLVFMVAGSVGMAAGAWRLHQVRALGDRWRRRTRELLIATVLVAYLCPFYLMWREVPLQAYLLGHTLVFAGMFFYALVTMCQTVAGLGRAAGRRPLVIQAIAFGTVTVVVGFPPFVLFGEVMYLAARAGRDPWALLQLWLARAQFWMVPALLVPFALTLSLVWAAKDLALERLLAARERQEV
jgi:hypothetical protein